MTSNCHVGVHCVGHFPLPARAQKGVPGWSPPLASQPREESLAFEGTPTPMRGKDVSGFGEGFLGLLGRMKARKGGGSRGSPPSPPGKWANEKHTLAGTVFTREFNYPVF